MITRRLTPVRRSISTRIKSGLASVATSLAQRSSTAIAAASSNLCMAIRARAPATSGSRGVPCRRVGSRPGATREGRRRAGRHGVDQAPEPIDLGGGLSLLSSLPQLGGGLIQPSLRQGAGGGPQIGRGPIRPSTQPARRERKRRQSQTQRQHQEARRTAPPPPRAARPVRILAHRFLMTSRITVRDRNFTFAGYHRLGRVLPYPAIDRGTPRVSAAFPAPQANASPPLATHLGADQLCRWNRSTRSEVDDFGPDSPDLGNQGTPLSHP